MNFLMHSRIQLRSLVHSAWEDDPIPDPETISQDLMYDGPSLVDEGRYIAGKKFSELNLDQPEIRVCDWFSGIDLNARWYYAAAFILHALNLEFEDKGSRGVLDHPEIALFSFLGEKAVIETACDLLNTRKQIALKKFLRFVFFCFDFYSLDRLAEENPKEMQGLLELAKILADDMDPVVGE